MKKIVEKVLGLFRIRLAEEKIDLLTQFIKFGLIGVTNTLISYGIYLLVIWIMVPYNFAYDYLIGSILGFIISVLWSFYWNNKLVFTEDRGKRSILKSLLKTYLSYGFTGVILSNVFLYVFVNLMGIHKLIAPVLNLLITVPLNFILNKYWAFRKAKKEKA